MHDRARGQSEMPNEIARPVPPDTFKRTIVQRALTSGLSILCKCFQIGQSGPST